MRTAGLMMLLCVTSCAPAADSFCVAARPLRLSDAAVTAMTRDDLIQVNTLNDTYARLCR